MLPPTRPTENHDMDSNSQLGRMPFGGICTCLRAYPSKWPYKVTQYLGHRARQPINIARAQHTTSFGNFR